MMTEGLYIINARGEKEPFSKNKIYRGLIKTGIGRKSAQDIAEIIKKESFSGITTSQIAAKVRKILKQEAPKSALKFNLKEAMLKLGPTGFPFEKYIKEVFLNLGYKVKLNPRLRGASGAEYEIDILAKKRKTIYLGECKYNHKKGIRVDLKTILAVYARYLDIKKHFHLKKENNLSIKPLIITNAKFTSQAIRYSNYYKIFILGWKYPRKNGLENLIEKNGLYPITILPSFRPELQRIFFDENKILVKDIFKINLSKFFQKHKIAPSFLEKILQEAKILLR